MQSIKDAIPEDRLNEGAKKGNERIEEIEEMVNRGYIIFETNKHVNDFQRFETIRCFAENFLGGEVTLNNADEDQSNLLVEKEKSKTK